MFLVKAFFLTRANLCFSGFPREENELMKISRFQNSRVLTRDTPSNKVKQTKKQKGKRKHKTGKQQNGGKKRKSKRGKKKRRTKKGKKSKAGKNTRKEKRRNGKGKKQNARQENSNCKNLTCLNDILEVLKVDKDTVQNFIQQNRRLKSRLELAGFRLFHPISSFLFILSSTKSATFRFLSIQSNLFSFLQLSLFWWVSF